MKSIKVDVVGLIASGSVCLREADILLVRHVRQPAGPGFQATTNAIQQIASVVDSAEGLISVRLRLTGHKLVTTATWLGEREATSQKEIAALPSEPAVT